MTGPELAEPYASAETVASIRYGCRSITLTLPGPSTLHRNRFARAWLEVTERRAWGAEAWISAQRYAVDGSHVRSSFTDAGRRAIERDVLPAVHRYGFGQWWEELHQGRTEGPRMNIERAKDQAKKARRVVKWWDELAVLLSAHQAGLVELRQVIPDRNHRGRTVLVVDRYGAVERIPCMAFAYLDGEHVGWLTERADIVPVDDLIAD